MCLLKDDCLAYSDGDCPIIRKDADDDCPGRYIPFCKFCYICEYKLNCKDECKLENEAIQNKI